MQQKMHGLDKRPCVFPKTVSELHEASLRVTCKEAASHLLGRERLKSKYWDTLASKLSLIVFGDAMFFEDDSGDEIEVDLSDDSDADL